MVFVYTIRGIGMLRKKKKFLSVYAILMSVMLVSCKGIAGKTISVGSDNLDSTQSYFSESMHEIARCDSGYYYLNKCSASAKNIMFYDDKSGESIVLCNKPQCEHNSEECMAYISGSEFKSKLYYYNSCIYMLSTKGNLVQISADGTQRTDLGSICVMSDQDSVSVCFNDGYAYISQEISGDIEGNVTARLYRFNLDTGSSDVIYEETGYGIGINSLKTYGKDTFFIKTSVAKDDKGLYSLEGKGIYRITGDNTECVLDKNAYSYCIDADNNTMYYSGLGDGTVYACNLDSGKSESIYKSDNDTGYFYITFDGNYIWMDDEGYKSMAMYFNKQSSSLDYTIYQLDTEGKLVAKRTIPDNEKIFSIMHGDGRKMFMFSSVNNQIVYIDKSNIVNGDIKGLK